MIFVVTVLLFWLIPTQSDDTMSKLGWVIMGIIIAGIAGCWICVVIKKVVFIFCERSQLSANRSTKSKKETKD